MAFSDNIKGAALMAAAMSAFTVNDTFIKLIRYYFNAPKSCAAKCPVAYARHASRLDGWRSQAEEPMQLTAAPLVQIRKKAA